MRTPSRLALLPLLALGACPAPPAPTDASLDATTTPDADAGPLPPIVLSNSDATVTIRTAPFGMRITDASGRTLLDTLDADPNASGDSLHAYGPVGATHHESLIRSPIIEGWDHTRNFDDPWWHTSEVVRATTTASSAALDLRDPNTPGSLIRFSVELDGPEVRVRADASLDPAQNPSPDAGGVLPPTHVGQSFALPADEHFFALGERYVTVDHRGNHFECWTEEGGLGQGEGTPAGPQNPYPNGPGMTHVPVPFVLSNRGYGLWIETNYRTGFALGDTLDTAWRIHSFEPSLRYRVLVHHDPRATLEHFTRLTGRARLPAPWVFGPRRRVDHGSMVRGVPEEQALRDFDVPTTMVDDTMHFLPYAGQVGREDFLRTWTAQMHSMGFKAIGYFNPYVSAEDPAAADLLAYGRAHDLFVRTDDGAEFLTLVSSGGPRQTATIDLTKPEAITWYESILQGALDLGYDGWMQDFAEYIPPRARMSDGRSGFEAHNAFPVLVERVVFNYLRRVRGDDFMFYSRGGYTGVQSVTPVVWSGDPSASFDDTRGLPSSVRAAINAGLSGIPYWGSDVSGYTCLHDPPADKEVYLRWAEFGALSPDMHDENACAGAPAGSPPKWNLWSDDETIAVYGSYARLHTRLFPYLYAAAREAQDTGVPIVRHPLLHHPDAPEAVAVELEYYFGPDLYVAPVVRRDERTRSLWLPPGRWVDWFSLEPLTGNAMVTRPAPLDALPMFLRSGGVVALLDPSVDTLAPDSSDTVQSLYDTGIAGVFDVRAAIDPSAARGHSELVSGEVLEVSLAAGAAVTLPPEVTNATDESMLAACDSCGRIDPLPGGASRVRATTARTNDATLSLGALTLRHHAIAPARIRWDVVVLPSS